ncbi:MAG: DNA/RNA helicase domain-containing protein, partial [Blastomonas fulva]
MKTRLSRIRESISDSSIPGTLHAAIEQKNSTNAARVVAGYCWPWTSKKSPQSFDIVIGSDYRRRWNLDVDGSLWIVAPNSINEVGCIHTCQG